MGMGAFFQQKSVANPMQITFRFFSVSRELAGCNQLSLEIPNASNLEQALMTLFEKKPALRAIEKSSMYAIGLDYATHSDPVGAGDEIAIIPPVQGG